MDDLFFEYTRLLKGIRPKVFVAENVKGLTIGTAKGYFKLILRALKECGYRVKAAVLNAQHLGVPQSRERLIFIGVRKDLNQDPVYPKPVSYTHLDVYKRQAAGTGQRRHGENAFTGKEGSTCTTRTSRFNCWSIWRCITRKQVGRQHSCKFWPRIGPKTSRSRCV